jgi:hypothetical protein
VKPALVKRLEGLEEQAGMLPQHHFIWDDGDIDLEAEVAALIASGRARPGDRFHAVSWRQGEPEHDVHPDHLHPPLAQGVAAPRLSRIVAAKPRTQTLDRPLAGGKSLKFVNDINAL